MKSKDGKSIQSNLLGKLGFSLDKSGKASRRDIASFQKKNGLKATGVLDPETVKAIKAQAATAMPTIPAKGAEGGRAGAAPGAAKPELKMSDLAPALRTGFLVRGRVTDARGSLLAGLAVQAFDAGFRGAASLGQAVTDGRGAYAISYKKKVATLTVKVSDRAGKALAESTVFDPAPVQTVDLSAEAPEARRSEYQTLTEALAPLLKGAAWESLVEGDVAYLSGRAGVPPVRVAFLAAAHRNAKRTGVAAEAFYGLFRQELPTALDSLLLEKPSALTRALETAARNNVVSAEQGRKAAQTASALHGGLGAHVLRAPGGSVGGVLETAGLSPSEQESFLSAAVAHEGAAEDLWASLRSGPLKGKVERLQDALTLNALTGGNAPLFRELSKRKIAAPRDLSSLERGELEKLLLATPAALEALPGLAGETPEQKAARAAGEVMDAAEHAFPSAFLRRRLEGGAEDPVRRGAARVLAQAPDFELRDGDVDKLVKENPGVLAGAADGAAVVSRLKGLQRVMRVASATHADALVSAGITSARDITSLSPQAFEDQFAAVLGGAPAARATYEKAKKTTAMVSSLASLSASMVSALPQVIGGAGKAAPKGVPDFTQLFGAYSFCECRDCRSVYSPAAYLVDLLQFINPRTGVKPLHVLRQRRPDIEHIKLTCENTNTELPKVDLANEILEFMTVHGHLTAGAARDTGDTPSEELLAAPRHVEKAAYDILADAVYPPSLPFHLPLATARTFLDSLEAPRFELMKAFRKGGTPSLSALAQESLGISPKERNVLIGSDGHALREMYGYAAETVAATNDQGNPVTEAWRVNLARVPEFLRRTETDYDGLVQLLASRFVDPQNAMFLKETGTPPSCDLSKTRIQDMTDAHLGKAHRFLRLSRVLGWSLPDTDRALAVLQAADITDEFLRKLAAARRLKENLNLSLPDLFCLWADLDEASYGALFLNRVVANPPDPDFALNGAGTALQNAGKTLSEKSSAVMAALRLSAEDLAALRTDAGLAGDDAPLSLPSLSALYRRAVLARALGLRAGEFASLRALTALDPFQPGEPMPTETFVDRARRAASSPFSIKQLDYLYRHVSDPAAPPAPGAEAVDSLLLELTEGLSKLAEAEDAPPELSPDAFIRQTLAGRLSVEADVMQALVERALRSVQDPALFASADLSALAAGTLPADAFHALYARLHKACLLIAGFGVTAKELSHLAAHAADFGGADVNALPADPSGFTPGLFHSWERLRDLFDLRDSLPQAGADLVDVFAAATVAEALDLLKKASGWDPARLDILAGPEGFDLNAGDFKDERRLLELRRALDLARRVGASCATLFQWASGEPNDQEARQVVGAAKAKYDPKTWLAAARPLNDGLRRRRRDALVAHLLAGEGMRSKGITDGNQLFEYFLLDVETGTEVTTSRIAQAIASVQLFIQRSLMNLETLSPALIDAEQWEWMKNYRVWEANRKVFLYPENWIEPELRDDKSPFFKSLENRLMQNDVTATAAEDAFVGYLEELDGVARLEIVGHCHESLEDGDVLHVVGRTHQSPHTHYYRRRVGEVWTAWEKIDLDIEGDHVILAAFNRRLYLFWPHFEEKPNAKQVLDKPYIQSMEHWTWEIEMWNWKFAHADWVATKAAHDVWDSIRSIIDATNQGLDGDEKIGYPEEPAVPGEEPREPQEPEYSTPPSLSHAEITLAWIEYRDGVWSHRQTAPYAMASSFVTRTMKEFGSDITDGAFPWDFWLAPLHSMFPLAKGPNFGDTIVDVYVPRPKEHFFRTEIEKATGDLIITVFRRYSRNYKVLDIGTENYKGYQRIGHFRVIGGGKVNTVMVVTQRDYESLSRPDESTNRAMFLGQTGGEGLSLTPDNGPALKVLGKSPEHGGNYALLREPRNAGFKLPQETFFFQDDLKTYYAHLKEKWYGKTIVGRGALTPTFLFGAPKQDGLVSFVKSGFDWAPAAERSLTGAVAEGRGSASGSMALLGSPAAGNAFGGTAGAGGMMLGGSAAGNASAGSSAAGGMSTGGASMGAGVSMTGWTLGEIADASVAGTLKKKASKIQFETFFHPHVTSFVKALYREGVPELLRRNNQMLTHDVGKNLFKTLYDPQPIVFSVLPQENVDFSAGGAYALYNWELFFHAPLLIAESLTKNQRFEEAQAWFHHIFNPTTNSTLPSPQRYWNTLPFFKNDHPEKDRVQDLLTALATDSPAGEAEEVRRQIEAWRNDPFNPHLIARMRITAYQKNVVMKYVDNLIQWGDNLFAQDTAEAINEAMLLYVLAGDILGPRPTPIPSHVKIEPRSYAQLRAEGLDEFSNALVSFENMVPYVDEGPTPYMFYSAKKLGTASLIQSSKPTWAAAPTVQTAAETFYFGIPPNDDMLKCWDTVEDRLFKIRHGMNIEGVERSLSLFAPPIDPALLVKARAAGLDLGGVISDMAAPAPVYRFNVVLQKALELCGELKSLGGALLSALEKKDGEALSLLRAGHESAVLKAVRELKKLQIDEAEKALEGLRRSQTVVRARRDHFRDISRINANEQEHMDDLAMANIFNQISQGVGSAASAAHLVPDFHFGTSGSFSSPVTVASYGGSNVGSGIQSLATHIAMVAAQFSHAGSMASIKGGYDRRWEEWKFQEALANKELDQLDSQIAGGEIRASIARQDLANQESQIADSRAVETAMRAKYTNQELYNWMIGQVSKVYFQAYSLAYATAKKAEKAFRQERGLTDSSFIQFGYWDSLKKGLMAGERLALDLKRMEAAYLDQNKRDLEISKQVSLAQLDPAALLALKVTGQCEFTLPEAAFDMDYPGHYMRRIKTVGVTVPCVVGPYAGVNATLTLLENEVRVEPSAQGVYAKTQPDDARFVKDFAAVQSVAVSHAQNDAGLFELNFKDERFLPFEGAGAVSRWRLSLPPEFRPFDYDTISDVVVHLKYTARDAGGPLKAAATQAAKDWVKDQAALPLSRLFSARHEFPNDWHRFLHPADGAADQALSLDLGADRFPFPFQGKALTVGRMDVFLKVKGAYSDGQPLVFNLSKQNGPSFPGNALLSSGSPVAGMPAVSRTMQEAPGAWTLTVTSAAAQALPAAFKKTVQTGQGNVVRLNPAAIEDLWVVCRYSAQ